MNVYHDTNKINALIGIKRLSSVVPAQFCLWTEWGM